MLGASSSEKVIIEGSLFSDTKFDISDLVN
jgi:hypothetical protein